MPKYLRYHPPRTSSQHSEYPRISLSGTQSPSQILFPVTSYNILIFLALPVINS